MDVSRVLDLVRPFFDSRKEPAFASDRTRYSDLADLQFLLALPGLDREESRSYFESAGLADYFDRLGHR